MTDSSGTARLDRLRRRALTSEEDTPRFFTSSLDGAPRWVGGLLAGLQGALLSLLVVVLPAVTAYVVTSADPTNSGVPWTRPVAFGAAVWLLAHGVPMTIGGAVVTLAPLGVTLLAIFTCHVSARRSGYATALSLAAGVGGYTVVAMVVALLVRASAADAILAALGAVIVSGIGLATGLARRPEARSVREITRPLWSRVVAPVRTGVAAGALAGALLVMAASITVVLWVVAGRDSIVGILRPLGLDAVGGGVLALGELAFVPNVVVWGLTWIAGPGFHVGSGTVFSAAHVVSGPLPAIPLLGALPQPDAAGGLLVLAPALLVVAGAVTGFWMRRGAAAERWKGALLASPAAAVTAGTVAGLLVQLATGAVGPGRMADLGASWLVVGAAVSGEVLLGALLVARPVESALREHVGRAWRAVSGRGPATAAEPQS